MLTLKEVDSQGQTETDLPDVQSKALPTRANCSRQVVSSDNGHVELRRLSHAPSLLIVFSVSVTPVCFYQFL